MRPLTPFVSYLENNGLPLVGRLRFCNMDGSPAQVFESDGVTSLGTVVFTDSSGRPTPQPFLEDHDYLIFFDKYVGINTMTEDTEEDSWREQGSAIDRYNTLGVELEAQCYRTIDKMVDLRYASPLSEDEMVMLLGYSSKFDKEPIFYRWDPNSDETDNGGSVIQRFGSVHGRWVITECPRYLDVRHFGAFPMQGIEANSSQRYRIQLASIYAHSEGKGLFFAANGEESYYDISNLELYDVDCDANARVFAVDGNNSTTITGIKCIYCASDDGCDGTISLVDDTVRTSWEGDSRHVHLVPTRKLIMDSVLMAATPPSFYEVGVDIAVYSYVTLDRCSIECNGKITGPIKLRNCEVKASWFVDGYDWDDLVSEDNILLIDNLGSADTYVRLKNMQEEADYGDLREETLTGATLLSGCVVDNAVLDGCTVSGSAEFHNVSGTVTITASGQGDMLWFDSFIEVTNLTTGVASLSLLRGEVRGGGSITVSGDLRIEDSVVSSSFSVGGDIVAYRNAINSTVMHMASSSTVKEQFIGNTFNAVLNIEPQVSGSKFDARWIDNYGSVNSASVPGPIYINRLNVDPDDAEHNYVYRENGGTFLPDITECKAVTLTVKTVPNTADSRTESIVRNAGTLTLIKPTRTSPDYDYVSAGAYNYGGNYFDTVNFFRIGTSAFRVHADIAMIAREAVYFQQLMPVKQVLGTEFVSGHTFRLKTPLNGEWGGTNKALSAFPSMYSTMMLWNFTAGEGLPSELPADETFSVEIRYEALDRHL